MYMNGESFQYIIHIIEYVKYLFIINDLCAKSMWPDISIVSVARYAAPDLVEGLCT